VLLRTDPEAAKNPLIFPTPAMLKQLPPVRPDALFNPDYKQKWQKLLGPERTRRAAHAGGSIHRTAG
jgi:hypothetical protein